MSRFLRAVFGGTKQDIWRQLAERVEGQFVQGGLFAADVVQVRSADWIVTLDTYSDGDNNTYTRIRAPYVNPEGFRFSIYRINVFAAVGKLFGLQDIEVGYPLFDTEFVIKGSSEPRVQRLFDNARLRELIIKVPWIHLEVRDDAGWFGERFPDGVDELYFRCRGVIKDLDRLEVMFELFAEVLNQLCHEGMAYEDDPLVHIRRLRGPGGRVKGKHLLWDGDRARREAAEALVRLGDPRAIGALAAVLETDDKLLRAKAIEALAATASEKAVRPLVRLLGNATIEHGVRVRDRAAEALRSLGAGELVDSVLAALDGDASGLGERVGDYRAQVIDALVGALRGAWAAHAAKALEELDAAEALPRLRREVREGAWGPRREAIEAAIRELEARASLPRPAEASDPPAGRTLPRTAGEAPGPPDTLPRATPDEP